MHEQAQNEINQLHDFFEAWFAASVPQTRDEFARVISVLGDEFVLISPDGRITARADLLENIYGAHGGRNNFRIWIENFRLQEEIGDIVVATYEEWQTLNGGGSEEKTTARISTAIFRKQPDAPNGLEWLHVHETWVP